MSVMNPKKTKKSSKKTLLIKIFNFNDLENLTQAIKLIKYKNCNILPYKTSQIFYLLL